MSLTIINIFHVLSTIFLTRLQIPTKYTACIKQSKNRYISAIKSTRRFNATKRYGYQVARKDRVASTDEARCGKRLAPGTGIGMISIEII